MNWLTAILKPLFDSLLGALKGWYEDERKSELEWAAKSHEARMDAFGDTLKVEHRIAKKQPEKAVTPSAWNKGVPVILLIAVLQQGCLFTKYIHDSGPWPVIDRPARPRVSEKPAEWGARERILRDYALELEARVDAYNAEACAHNRKHDYPETTPEVCDEFETPEKP